MIRAPPAARLPYRAVAPGPFNTVTLSISSGLISDMSEAKSTGASGERLPLKPVPEILLLIGAPSMTMSASVLSRFNEFSPLKVIREQLMGPAPVPCILRPATLPDREVAQLLVLAS